MVYNQVFKVMEKSAENIEEKKKTDRRKRWKVKRKKNKQYEETQIATTYIFGFKLYFAQKHSLNKSCLYHKFYLQVLCVAGYLKHINNTQKLNIHKYKNYNIIEIYMNRLSITTQIFIVIYCLIMMLGKCLYFLKKTFG